MSGASGRTAAHHDWRACLDRFEQAWQSGTPPSIAETLRTLADPASRRRLLEELVLVDLEYRWRQGGAAGTRLEEYVRCHAELAGLSLALIEGEYRARRLWGDRPGHEEYLTRFPQFRGELPAALTRLDADLAAEFAQQGRVLLAGALAGADNNVPAAKPAPAVVSAGGLREALRRHQLLTPSQFESVAQETPADARALAATLLQRDWLTPYQVNQLLLDRGTELVLGPYVLLERLGEGGMGQVFRARHQAMNRIVALKKVRPELLADAEVLRRFYQEIAVISQLTHPNIVHAFDAGPVGAAHVLVMEYVEGLDLAQVVVKQGPLPVAAACDYLRQAALGLQHAHERGLVHRDLKPSNLMLTGDSGTIKILDLGLARLYRNADGALTTTVTPEGPVTMGTVDFMAPEQALNFHTADIRADIYSLGCTLYFLLSGQAPYPTGSLAEKLLRHQQDPAPAIERQRPDVPLGVRQVLSRMLAKAPADRFPTPAALADALEPAALAGAARRGSRRRWLAAGAGATVAALGGWTAARWLEAESTPPAPPALPPPLERLDRAAIAPRLLANLPPEVVAVLRPQTKSPARVRFAISPDATLLAYTVMTGYNDPENSARLRDLAGGTEKVLPRFVNSNLAPFFSPDGRFLIYGARDQGTLWDIRQEKLLPPVFVSPITNNPEALAFAADSKSLAVGKPGGNGPTLWTVPGGKPGLPLEELPARGVTSLSFARDNRHLAAGSAEPREVTIWDVTTGKVVRRIPEAGPLVAFAPEGPTLASGWTYSKDIFFWDATTGASTGKLPANLVLVGGFAFAPNGQIAVAGRDAQRKPRLTVWNWPTATLTYEARVPAPVNQLAFASDGRHLFTADEQGSIMAFRLGGMPRGEP